MCGITQIVWNRTERRIRAGWRILLHFGLWGSAQIISGLIIGSPVAIGLTKVLPGLQPIIDSLLFALLNLTLVVVATLVMALYIDRRPIRAIGLQFDPAWWSDLGFGLVLGALLMAGIFMTEWLLGWVSVVALFSAGLPNQPWAIMIWQPLVLFIVVGISEELLSRGYQLRNFAEGLATAMHRRPVAVVVAWLLSSILFGLLHIFNPNSSWRSTLGLVLVGGGWGVGYLLTGRLGISIGLHITWNFFQGNVFGFPVSGNVLSPATVIQIQQHGPPSWTGGAFGPEAGLMGVVAILLGTLLTYWWVQHTYGEVRIQLALADYLPRNATVAPSDPHPAQQIRN
ncbi:MAG: CPBP family intramembrane metalloprotease [Caldilineaceae bacterium]|nr:CPBP family intramembrane metalloprotease [Caldilineaceae bacterium]